MKITDVFIVEDDQFFAQSISNRLKSLGEFKIHHFTDVHTALSKSLEYKPQLIFLDNILRKGDNGVDSVSKWVEILPQSEIAVMSNNKDVKILAKAMESGASEFINKDQYFMQNMEDFLTGLEKDSEKRKFWSRITKVLNPSTTRFLTV